MKTFEEAFARHFAEETRPEKPRIEHVPNLQEEYGDIAEQVGSNANFALMCSHLGGGLISGRLTMPNLMHALFVKGLIVGLEMNRQELPKL